MYLTKHFQFISPVGLYDTVFDVDHDKERAQGLDLEPNGFSFDGADSAGVDYALNRWVNLFPVQGSRQIYFS